MNIALVVDPLERAPEYVRWVATMRTGLERAGYRVRLITCPAPGELVVLTSEGQRHLAPDALMVSPGSEVAECLSLLATL